MTHGGVIKTIISRLLNVSLEESINMEIGNCSINSFEFSSLDKLLSYEINNIKHLEVKL